MSTTDMTNDRFTAASQGLDDPDRPAGPTPNHPSPPDGLVRFVDLAAEYRALSTELNAAVGKVMERGDFILGEAVTRFEHEFASYCGSAHAVGVDSGFSALELILRAFDVGPGDEVIIPANTFYSTARAIEAVGATPVLVDADPRSRNIDPRLIEAAITGSTRVLMPVHLYGHPADMDAVNQIAQAHDLVVVEDACQAHGSFHRGRRAGALADAAAFSFYPAKNLGAFGDGGIVVTDRSDVTDRVKAMRNLGSVVKYQHDGEGYNRRLDTIHAAVLSVKLHHLDEANAARRRVAELYATHLGDLEVTLPTTSEWAVPVHHLYVIEADDRDQLAAGLMERGVQTGIHYPVPIHLQPAFASLGYSVGDFPVSERLADRILSLPMHPHLTDDDISQVCQAVRAVLASAPEGE